MSLALPGARRALASTLALGAFALAGSACARGHVPPPSSPSLDAAAPRYLGAVVNNVRADYGRGSLQMAYDASAKAQALAQSMADQSRIFHSTNLAAGIAPGWTALAENVASAESQPAGSAMRK